MAKFEVITHSTCELVYWVEADSFSQATQIALDGTAQFVQNHIGEQVISQAHLEADAEFVDWLNGWREREYF